MSELVGSEYRFDDVGYYSDFISFLLNDRR